MHAPPLLQITGLSKSYGGVHALRNVDLQLAAGEVLAICGENGAGKSTLIKVLTGVETPDAGTILVRGEPLECGQVRRSEAAGIAVMHQESTVFPDLNALDNLFVGRERTRFGGWLLDRRAMRRATQAIFDRLGEMIDLSVPVRDLSVAQRQMVAMARALSRNCQILIMDEPTASLSARETETLLNLILQLRRDGVGILYVSHRLEEIFRIANRVTVLRDGEHVATYPVHEVTPQQLIRAMVGREVKALTHRSPRSGEQNRPVLQIHELTRIGFFEAVSLTIGAGEIVGLGGLVGAGRTEIARAIFGIDRYDSGSISVEGRRLSPGSIPAAIDAGIALVPEDRQHEGLVLPMSVGENLSLAVLNRMRRGLFIDTQQEKLFIQHQMAVLLVRASSPYCAATELSGGNQQKLVLGKWLATQPKVLILDEPTRGVDVGAKSQVHSLIRGLAEKGVAILVISSELTELLAISDRIIVVRQGRLVGELNGATATQEEVLALALPDAVEATA